MSASIQSNNIAIIETLCSIMTSEKSIIVIGSEECLACINISEVIFRQNYMLQVHVISHEALDTTCNAECLGEGSSFRHKNLSISTYDYVDRMEYM